MNVLNHGRSMICSRSYCNYLSSSMRIPKTHNNFNKYVKSTIVLSSLDNSCLCVPLAADVSDLKRGHVRVRIENPRASSFRQIQTRKFISAANEEKRDLVSMYYQSFADACRSEGGLISSDVEFQFDTSSGGEISATNNEKYKVKITRWGDEPELPFFSSGIPGKDCIVAPQDALSLRIVDRVLDSLLGNKLVELIGAPGIGKTSAMQQFLIHLLRHMGQKYRPEDPNDSRRYSSEVFLRTSEDQAFRFYLVEEKTGEVVKVERVEGGIEKLSDLFRARTRAAKNRGEVLPTLLLELDDDERNPNVFGRVLVTASVEDVDDKFKTLEKSGCPYIRLLMEPLSEGMMMALVRGLVRHSKHRDTDPFLSQFVDKDGKEIEGKICEVVRKRFFNVGGFMRDLLCYDSVYDEVLAKTRDQAKSPERWNLMRSICAQNIPKEIDGLVISVNNDKTLPRQYNTHFTFRSGLAVQLVCSNVSTLEDVEDLRRTHMYPEAIKLAWVYAALLDSNTFGCTPPATWHKDNMQFFSDPGHHRLDSQKHELRDDNVPVFPLCTRVVNGFGNTGSQEPAGQSIRDFAQGVLYMGHFSHTKVCQYFTLCHATKTVYAFRTSSLKPTHRLSAIEETDLKAAMSDIGMFEGEGRKYKLQLVYVVDGATSLANTKGWTMKNKDDNEFKICDLAKLSPEHFAFPPADGRKKRGEDRIHGVIASFQPWGFIVEPPIVALMTIIDKLEKADFYDLLRVSYLTWDRPVGGVAKLRKSLKAHLSAEGMEWELEAFLMYFRDKEKALKKRR